MRKRFVAFFFGAWVLAACAANKKAPEDPSSTQKSLDAKAEPEPTSVEEAESQIARAKASLADSESVAPTSPTTGPTPSEPGSGSGASGKCVKACRAIASMRRATAALCRLAGPEDARCADAKHVLAESEQRVSGCGC